MSSNLKNSRGYTLLELLYVISIICLLASMLIPQLLTQKNRAIEVTAQRRLRNIGSVMADYSLSQNQDNYATFQELKDANLITKGVTLSNIIVDYSLVILTTEKAAMGLPSRYTIIAYPRPENSFGELSTFAITEDNVVRVYHPGLGIKENDPHTWDPIL